MKDTLDYIIIGSGFGGSVSAMRLAEKGYRADGKSRILFKVVDVRPAPPATKEQRETLANELKGQIQGDLISSYVTALQDRLGVTINQAELKRVSGADAAR